MNDFLSTFLPSAPPSDGIECPRKLIIYGTFGVGKTKLAEWLARNLKALWLDCEDGSLCEGPGWSVPGAGTLLNIPAMLREKNAGLPEEKQVGPTGFLFKLCDELTKEHPRRYDYIVADKLDTLELWGERRATAYFKTTILGKNFTGTSVLELDKGAGYGMLRDQFDQIWSKLASAAPRIVLLASLKASHADKSISTVASVDLDLTGKVRKIAAGDADATGFLYREPDGTNWISFVTDDKDKFVKNRIARLEGRRFKLSWKGPDGKLKVDWNQLFPDAKPLDAGV